MHISSQLWIFKYFYPHLRKINWNSWNFTFISWRLWKQREDGLCMSRGLYAHLDSNFSSVFLICFFLLFCFFAQYYSKFSVFLPAVFYYYYFLSIFVYYCLFICALRLMDEIELVVRVGSSECWAMRCFSFRIYTFSVRWVFEIDLFSKS